MGSLSRVETWAGDLAELPGELPGTQPADQPPRKPFRKELAAAASTAVVLAILGVGVGLVWSAVSPQVGVVITADGPSLLPGSEDDYFAGEGVFVLIAVVVGLLSGVTTWYVVRRWRGPALLVALMVGGLAGALIAWQVGHHLGLAQFRALLQSTDVGREFHRPVDVRSRGILLVQPLAAALAYVLLASWTVRPDLQHAPRPN